jgi:hypothetical protein
MAQERARQVADEARDSGTASARAALEHPNMLFRFQRDPLEVAMHTAFEPSGGRPVLRQAPKRRSDRGG